MLVLFALHALVFGAVAFILLGFGVLMTFFPRRVQATFSTAPKWAQWYLGLPFLRIDSPLVTLNYRLVGIGSLVVGGGFAEATYGSIVGVLNLLAR